MADEVMEKAEGKAEKKEKKGQRFDATVSDAGANAMYTDAEEEGSSVTVVLIVLFIVIIWLAILGLLVKLDIGGFGSNVLYPVLKDVPVLNMILPDGVEEEKAARESDYATLADAVSEINRLNARIAELENGQGTDSPTQAQITEDELNAYKEEIKRLQTFESSQVDFQKVKTEFYEEVVFSDQAPGPEEYKKYYETIDPENAEYLYRQVVSQIEADKEMSEYVKAYSDMKPKQAAAIFEMMTENLDLVAKILGEMDPSSRGKILGVMDSEIASRITKIMDPD